MINLRCTFAGIIFLFLIPSALALEGKMKLLAVSDTDNEMYGSVADLHLEIRDGKGRVFLETFPLTKVDTQISMRFAKQIACKELNLDCKDLDFIYTIQSGSGIVGGPSAGAAASVLTASLLLGSSVNDGVSITGTINSGGIIGAVGGLKEKIEAAARSGIKKVLIPAGKRFQEIERKEKTEKDRNFAVSEKEDVDSNTINSTTNNNTNSKNNSNINRGLNNTINSAKNVSNDFLRIDLLEYGNSLGIDVAEVGTFDEAMHEMTGISLPKRNFSIMINEQYDRVMRDVARLLCERTKLLEKNLSIYSINEENLQKYNSSLEYGARAEELLTESDYYSAASFCFRANVQKSALLNYFANATQKETLRTLLDIEKNIDLIHENLSEKSLRTITDLQTFILVKDRLYEAEEYIRESRIRINNANSNVPFAEIALAKERVLSANTWEMFFGMPGKSLNLRDESLKESCISKIREAQERFQYLSLAIPNNVGHIEKQINQAHNQFNSNNYPLCIFEASKAKSSANVILSVIGSAEEQLKDILARKLESAEEMIFESQESNSFPIAGYSYYRYAQALSDEIQSALLFAEYSLEMSNLDIYFQQNNSKKIAVNWDSIMLFLMGVLIGIFVMEFVKKRDF